MVIGGLFFAKVENTFAKEPQSCPTRKKKEKRSNMLAWKNNCLWHKRQLVLLDSLLVCTNLVPIIFIKDIMLCFTQYFRRTLKLSKHVKYELKKRTWFPENQVSGLLIGLKFCLSCETLPVSNVFNSMSMKWR